MLSSLMLKAQTPIFTDTKGELSIGDSGQASYNLPIALPPSLKNVAPVINLTYSSGQRGGIAGQGWSINGISSITRMATRVDIDGFRDGVDFDDNDKLSLDGQRLLLKTGTYWADGSTYETEYKSNTKIELKIENAPGYGPQTYFVVTSPDGSQTWYGSTGAGVFQNATSLNAWFIVRFVDSFGNFITYNYTQFTYNGLAQTYIDNIKFSGNEGQGLAQINEIKFNYRTGNAARVETDYIKGQAFYASKILNNVQVLTGTIQFRKYVLSHLADDSGYERVSQVQEFNGANEPSNPVVFEYGAAVSNTPVFNLQRNESVIDFPNIKSAGDFDGDGINDFVTNNSLYLGSQNAFSGNNPIGLPPIYFFDSKVFNCNSINNGKYKQSTSLAILEGLQTNQFSFNIFDFNNSSNSFLQSYVKQISNNSTYNTTYINYTPGLLFFPWEVPNVSENVPATFFKEGDFNGDGITESILLQPGGCDRTIGYYLDVYSGNVAFTTTSSNCQSSKAILIDLNPNSSTIQNSPGNAVIADWDVVGSNAEKNHVMDFNGDGKSDILQINNDGSYFLTTLNFSNTSPFVTRVKIGEGFHSAFASGKPLIFGDYNGDGKPDIMVPHGVDSPNWGIFYSNPNPNGGEFFTIGQASGPIYKPYEESTGNAWWRDYRQYHAMDINKDGKTDLVSIKTSVYKPNWWDSDDIDNNFEIYAYTNNLGVNNSFNQTWHSGNYSSNTPSQQKAVVADFNLRNGSSADIFMLDSHNFVTNNVKTFNFKRDFNAENRLKTVTESSGNIVQGITFAPMINGGLYSSTNTATYPNIEITQNKDFYLVSKLTATINGVSKFQDFKYRSMISNFEYGAIGFARTARSSWYTASLTDKIWTVQEIDYNNRGASTNTWGTTNGANVFATVPSDLLSTKTNEFETYTNPTTKVYNVQLKKQTTIDHLTTVKNETNFLYDELVNGTTGFGLQTQTINNTYLGTVLQGTSTVDTTFENNQNGTGNTYFIGKPKTVNSSKTVYPNDDTKTDTRTSKELYTYTGANLTKIEKKGHNTAQSIFEEMTYDAFGNLLTKKISCPTASPILASRTITDEYDTATKRFVIKKTDHQGFVSTMQYNNIGQVTQSVKYFGAATPANLSSSTNFVFDSWGKLTQSTTTGGSTTALTSNTVYTKLATGGYTTKNSSNVDANESTSQYDVLGRVIKSTTKGFASGTTISKSVVYDELGRKTKEYEPYFTTLGKFTAYTYDNLQRPKTVTAPTGRLQTLTYNGLTTTSVDDTKTTTATVDALGNKVTTTDEGGTINFKYYANGQLKESDFGGHKITVTIDGWGNKTSMNDPNAGTYTYVTDEFGQSKTETTPKGATKYEYDNFGKLTKKTVLGDGTDVVTTYAYNAFAQLLTETSKKANNTAIDSFSYRYDNLKRLDKTTETNTAFTHSKTITFDTYSRPATETTVTTDTASGLSATVVAKSNYNAYNGMMDKITDANNATVWQLTGANAKMQALTAVLGNGVAITNTYDADNYFSSQRHSKNSVDIVNNTYSFDPLKGNLYNRENIALGTNEYFEFDNLDRLTTWYDYFETSVNCKFDGNIDGFTTTDNYNPLTTLNGRLRAEIGNNTIIEKKIGNIVAGKEINIEYEFNTFNDATCGGVGDLYSCNNANLWVKVFEKNPITSAVINVVNKQLTFNTINAQTNANASDSSTYLTVNNSDVFIQFYAIQYTTSPYGLNLNFTLDNFTAKVENTNTQNYDDRGRIETNNVGEYNYTNSATNGMYRKTSISMTPEATAYYNAKPLQTATYTMFKSPMTINESGLGATRFTYNSHLSRTKMQYGWSTGGNVAATSNVRTTSSTLAEAIPAPTGSYTKLKLYTDDGSTEIIRADGKIRIITYIGGNAYSAPLYNEKVKTTATSVITDNNYYLHRDYLGSIIAISNQAGIAIERRHFDAWGNLVKLQQNGVAIATPTSNGGLEALMLLDRGYTSHEHLAEVGLINMNGRLYDPKLHTFLMPDNFVQQPENTQNYNRYAYVLNNPLRYTDPSGELIDPISIGLAIGIGAFIGAATYYIGLHGQEGGWSWSGLAQATFIGAASAAVTFGIGSAAGSMFTNFYSQAAFQAVAHGTFQGGMTAINGGNFWNGFAAGALSSIASSAWSGTAIDSNGQAIAGTGFKSLSSVAGDVGQIAFGTVMGGVGALLTKGNFWQGAATGLVISSINYVTNKIKTNNYIDKQLKKAGYSRSDIIGMNDAELDLFGRTVFPEMYAAGGAPAFTVESDLINHAETEFDSYTRTVSIGIKPSSFTTNFKLASLIGHELVHAGDYFSGRFTMWSGFFGETYTNNLMEVRAYNWNINNNSMFINYNVYSNYNRQINYQPLILTPFKGI